MVRVPPSSCIHLFFRVTACRTQLQIKQISKKKGGKKSIYLFLDEQGGFELGGGNSPLIIYTCNEEILQLSENYSSREQGGKSLCFLGPQEKKN